MPGIRSAQNQLQFTAAFLRIANNQRGAILLLMLVTVTILGLSASIAGSTWTSIVQRAKEEDLLWKGNQIRQAIGTYYEGQSQVKEQGAANAPRQFPKSVDDLLQDNRTLTTKRHLRQPYLDPMTGENWEWIKAPAGGIQGVRSTSNKTPFKKDGFIEENKSFVGMWQYRDWEFIYQPKKKKKTTTPGTTPPTGTTPGTPSGTTSGTPFGTTQ